MRATFIVNLATKYLNKDLLTLCEQDVQRIISYLYEVQSMNS